MRSKYSPRPLALLFIACQRGNVARYRAKRRARSPRVMSQSRCGKMVNATSSTLSLPFRRSSRSSAWRTAGSSAIAPFSSKPVRLNTNGAISVPAQPRTWSSSRDQARDRSASSITTGAVAADVFDLLIRVILQMPIFSEAYVGLRRYTDEGRPGSRIGAGLDDAGANGPEQAAHREICFIYQPVSGAFRFRW